jgi:hypothetical protein
LFSAHQPRILQLLPGGVVLLDDLAIRQDGRLAFGRDLLPLQLELQRLGNRLAGGLWIGEEDVPVSL